MLLRMKQSFIFIFLAHNVFLCQSDYIDVQFITDFFEGRNVMVTANVCWNYGNLKELFMRLSTTSSSRSVAIYNNSTEFDFFFDYRSTDNYFVADLNNCQNSWNLLKTANQLSLFRYPLKWLLLSSTSDFELLMGLLRTYSIWPTSDVIVAKREEKRYYLLQPYRIDRTKEIIWENYGYWAQEIGLNEQLRKVPPTQRRSNLQQTKLRVSLVIEKEQSWQHLEDFRYPHVDGFLKQNWHVIKCMLEYCNISAEFIVAKDHGYLNKTSGKWSGVIGALHYGLSDISGSAVLINSERFLAVEFLTMINPSFIRFVLRKPPLSLISNIFVLPFYWTVWIATLAAICLFALALFIILNWETKYKQKINYQKHFGINDIILITFETLCQQGTVTESRSISGRIISFVFLTGFMFLYVAYSANIFALLQSTTKITSLEQLLNSPISVGGHDNNYMRNYLNYHGTDKIKREISRKKIGTKGYYSVEDGLEKVRTGFLALHIELGKAYHYILHKFTNTEICALQELEGYATSYGGYASVRHNSPYKEIIKVAYLKIDEHGLRARNYNRVFKRPKCYSKVAGFESVGILEFHPAILLWVFGVILSLIILGFELLLHKIGSRRANN